MIVKPHRLVSAAISLCALLGGLYAAPASATSNSITASPSPVSPGQTVTFSASLNPGVTASDATVVLWLYNNTGAYVGETSATGINFTAGQATAVTLAYATSSSLANGTYTYNLSYYNSAGYSSGGDALAGATGQTDAGSFTVGNATAPSYAITASPNPVAPGQVVTFSASLNPGVTASDATVTLWLYTSTGAYLGEASATAINFTAGRATAVTLTYATSSHLAAGTYTYNLTYYNSGGGALTGATGRTDAGSFAVGSVTPPSYSITVSPNPVAPGQPIIFSASLNPGVTASDATVTLWLYTSTGAYLGEASATGINFTAGKATAATLTYATSSSLANGTYTYNLAYYNSGGGALTGATGRTDAGSFTVGTNGQSLRQVCATAVVVALTWLPVTSATSYIVSRGGTAIATTALTTYSDTTVLASRTYTYSVAAIGASGNTLSSQSIGVITAAASTNGDAAYCPSSLISSMTWNWSSGFNQQNGSDLWSETWGADGNDYAFFGDGGGFFGGNSLGRASFGIGEIRGAAGVISSSTASNVYGGYEAAHPSTINGKVNSIIAIGSNFYAIGAIWQPGEGGPSGEPQHFEIVSSLGNAYSWADNYSNWIFCSATTGSDSFCPTSFVQFGAGNAGAIDGYVYVYGTLEQDFIGNGTPTSTYLARVPNNQILTKSAYQVFAGADQSGNPIWNSDWTTMQPIFTDHGPRPIPISMAVYNPALKRFIATGQGYVNQVAFYDAPNPWGPWTSIGYFNSNADNSGGWGNLGSASFESGVTGDALGIQFINKWASSDGLTIWAAFSSDGNAGSAAYLTPLQGQSMDSLSIVSVTIALAP